MKAAALLVLLILIFAGVAAYMLHQRGLLTRETLDLFVKHEPEPKEETTTPVEPAGLTASALKRNEEMKEEAERLRELAARLTMQRRELEADRTLIEKRLETLKPELAQSSTSEEMTRLVKMYEGMEPEQAAAILESLPNPTVAQILLQMRGRQAAGIMGSLSAGKAAGVSKLLVPEKVEAAP